MSAFKDWLTGLTSKTTPVDADETYLRDSVTGNSYKLTWANLKATLLAYFDTAYLKLAGGTLTGGTRTTSGSTLTITETWNNAAVTFPGPIVADVTDTASNSASLLANIKVGGVSKFSVDKNGAITASGTIVNSQGVLKAGSIFFRAANDLCLTSDAAEILALRRGTNAQTFRAYGTYTDASNYRRVSLAMTTAGVATLAPEGAGTGASGNVLHISGLPTSNPGPGILWNNAGTPAIGT